MVIGHVSIIDMECQEVTEEEMNLFGQGPSGPPETVAPSPVPDIDRGSVPDEPRAKLAALIERYKSLWDGALWTIKETSHRIRLKPDATPVRQHPYQSGPRTRAVEEADRGPIDEDLQVLTAVTRSSQTIMGRSEKTRPLGPNAVEELIEAQAEDSFCQYRRKV